MTEKKEIKVMIDYGDYSYGTIIQRLTDGLKEIGVGMSVEFFTDDAYAEILFKTK